MATATSASVLRIKDVATPIGLLQIAWVKVGSQVDIGVSVARLAELVGYENTPIHSLIERNPLLREYKVILETHDGNLRRLQAYLLTPGILGLLMKLSTPRVKDSAKKERIIVLQKWILEKASELRLEVEEPVFAQEPLPNNKRDPEKMNQMKVPLELWGAIVKQVEAMASLLRYVEQKGGTE